MRMTKQRQAILAIFKSTATPQSAEMIMDSLVDHTMNLSTVYRTLEVFYDAGLISKSTIDQTSYYYDNQKDHHHYMICLNCHKMVEVDCHLSHFADDVAKRHGFKITHHDMTLYGYCRDCQDALKE